MIARTYIESNLKQLDRLYLNAVTQKSKLYYSKLAMLELCGWIEESMDDMILRCSNRILKSTYNKKSIKIVIKKTAGFDYNLHFLKMLTFIIGLRNIEKLEKKLDPGKNLLLISTLNTLKAARNREAHTHLKGVTRQVDTPSLTISRFDSVFDGLKDFELHLKNIKY